MPQPLLHQVKQVKEFRIASQFTLKQMDMAVSNMNTNQVHTKPEESEPINISRKLHIALAILWGADEWFFTANKVLH